MCLCFSSFCFCSFLLHLQSSFFYPCISSWRTLLSNLWLLMSNSFSIFLHPRMFLYSIPLWGEVSLVIEFVVNSSFFQDLKNVCHFFVLHDFIWEICCHWNWCFLYVMHCFSLLAFKNFLFLLIFTVRYPVSWYGFLRI